MKPRNYGEEAREYEDYMSDDSSGDPPEFRDQIDFARYGGGYTSVPSGKPGHDGKVNTSELWNRVRKEIGIKDVDSENDLRQMFDYVTGYKNASQPDPAAEQPATVEEPKPEQPVQPSPGLTDQQKDFESARDDFDRGNLPRMNTDGNPYTDAINHGDDLNQHYQSKFLPYIRKQANLGASEIGETGRYQLGRFIGKVPELGDPKEMFEYYADKIKD